MNKNIILCGVGGQGTVLASKLIAASAMEKGLKVMSAETIGMAQRGGNVFSNIRISDDEELYAPMIGKCQADLILGFEPGETVRMLPFLKEGGYVITNLRAVKPTTATLQGSSYDSEEMINYLKSVIPEDRLLIVDGTQAITELGNARCLNVVLLGAAVRTGALGLTEEDVLSSMPKVIKPKFLALNEEAFRYVK